MKIDITQIVELVITLLCTLVTVFVIPWIKQKFNNDKLAQIINWVKIAVQAAEQTYVGSGRGAEKKEYVLDFLASKGIKMDLDSIDNIIESEVYNLQQLLLTTEEIDVVEDK